MHGAGENWMHQTCRKFTNFDISGIHKAEHIVVCDEIGKCFRFADVEFQVYCARPPPQILQSAVRARHTGSGLAAMVSDNVT